MIDRGLAHLDSVRRNPQGPAMLAPGGTVRSEAFSLRVGGWTLTARFRCLIRPNPLVRPVPPQPARENGNTLSQEVSLVPLQPPLAIGQRAPGHAVRIRGGPLRRQRLTNIRRRQQLEFWAPGRCLAYPVRFNERVRNNLRQLLGRRAHLMRYSRQEGGESTRNPTDDER